MEINSKALDRFKEANQTNEEATIDKLVDFLEEEIERLENVCSQVIEKKTRIIKETHELANRKRELQNRYKLLKYQFNCLERETGVKVTDLNYLRIAIYKNVEELLTNICNCTESKYDLGNGYTVKPVSLRYHTFHEKGLSCVECGIKGSFLALEKGLSDHGKTYHLNLYALDEKGNEVLMTKDHIIPKSKGGLDVLENLQTMCKHCNEKKGSNI